MGKVNFNSNEGHIEVIVRDSNSARLDTFRFNLSAGRDFARVIKTLKNKYGVNPIFKKTDMLDVDGEFWSY